MSLQTPAIHRGFWARHPEYNMPDMLTSQEKTDLADTGFVFDILSVRDIVTKQFGPTWILTISINTMLRSLFLSKNDVRDEMVENMRAHFRTDGVPIPARLGSFLTNSGFEAWSILPPNTDDVPMIDYDPEPATDYDAEQALYGDDHTSAGHDEG